MLKRNKELLLESSLQDNTTTLTRAEMGNLLVTLYFPVLRGIPDMGGWSGIGFVVVIKLDL